MMDAHPVQIEHQEGPLANPWHLLLAGLVVTGVAVVLGRVAGSLALGELRFLLICIGLSAAGWAIACRPRAEVIFAAVAIALMGWVAVPPDWDSIRLVLAVLITVGIFCGVVVMLPRVVRRVVVSLLIILHFGGILTAITSAPPPNSQGNWVINQVWTNFYRPYLQFTYLNNAYHFYSPEPGPAFDIWVRIAYADGSSKRLRMVERDLYPLRLEYQRRLALASQTEPRQQQTPEIDRLLGERQAAGEYHRPKIPMHRDIPATGQYRVPSFFVKQILSSFARYYAENNPHPAGHAVTGVKLYHVTHLILNATEIAAGVSPTDPTTYVATYLGDFDGKGQLKEGYYDDKGELHDACFRQKFDERDVLRVEYQDPFLYWIIPIQREAANIPQPNVQSGNAMTLTRQSPAEQRVRQLLALPVRNYVKIHAGDKDDDGDEPW